MQKETKRRVFYSFDYDEDVHRMQQIRNMGVIEDDGRSLNSAKFEEAKKKGAQGIKDWIDSNMKGCSCVVVLIGEKTSESDWVKYEIEKAYNEGKGLLGVYIHNFKDLNGETSKKGESPFSTFNFENEIDLYNPPKENAYSFVKKNLTDWVEEAIEQA